MRAAPATPPHVVEHFLVHDAHLRGERQWIEDVLGRLREGQYGFVGEGGVFGYDVPSPR